MEGAHKSGASQTKPKLWTREKKTLREKITLVFFWRSLLTSPSPPEAPPRHFNEWPTSRSRRGSALCGAPLRRQQSTRRPEEEEEEREAAPLPPSARLQQLRLSLFQRTKGAKPLPLPGRKRPPSSPCSPSATPSTPSCSSSPVSNHDTSCSPTIPQQLHPPSHAPTAHRKPQTASQ